MPFIYHVAKTGCDKNSGAETSPFLTINAAAGKALPGDTVVVHAGEYREWVDPPRGGLSNTRRITYRAAENEHVVIKGSEHVQNWEQVEGTVWKAALPNALFGEYNPYREVLDGDWLIFRSGLCHPGDVYLNGKSFYEAETLEALRAPAVRTEVLDNWTEEVVPIHDPEQTKYLWYAEVDDEYTTLWANFHGADPNRELVEVNVRKCCFYPRATGCNYITVRGFEMCHAATPWAPPTADQPGLLGAHWSRGWVIEDNVIHDAKCSGISIGKEVSTGDNFSTRRKDKPGYQYQLESVFAAAKAGWSRESVGSHIIRRNTIHDCGQNGIVGHLGGIFSEIHHNHIYNIALKREFYGHEIAGIKLHAAIDVYIHHNHIHHCSLGAWMDWQAQGTRISKNLFHHNNRDLFVEVTHGPHLVDHNIFGSKHALDNHAQGGAYVNNLFAGKIVHKRILDRATPYHPPHSTDVAGYAIVYGGDDRLYSNLFIGPGAGTFGYDGHSTSLNAFMESVQASPFGDHESFQSVRQPVYIEGNVYLEGATPFENEANRLEQPLFDAKLSIEEKADGVYLSLALPEGFDAREREPRTTQTLGNVRLVGADYENPDGSPLRLDTDYFDTHIEGGAVPGPMASLKAGQNHFRVW